MPDAILVETAEKNLHDPTPFSLMGNDPNTYGGFLTFSGYLLTHPALRGNEKLILQYLVYRADDYERVMECEDVLSRASLADIQREMGVSKPTATRSLGRLEGFGIIRKVQVGREHMYELLAGPWPLLGDRPERGNRWRDFTLRAGKTVGRWVGRFFGRVVTREEVEAFVREEVEMSRESFLSKSRKRQKKAREGNQNFTDRDQNFTDAEISVPSDRSTFFTSPGANPTPQVGIGEGAENDVRDANFLSEPRAGAGARAGSKIDIGNGSSRERAGGPRPLQAEPQQANPQPEIEEDPGDDGRSNACISDRNTEYTPPVAAARELSSRLEAAKRPAPKKGVNPKSRFQHVYRTRLDDEYDKIVGPFNAAEHKMVARSFKNYGAETMLLAVDWLFDNWSRLQKAQPWLYDKNKYPPLRSLVTKRLMDEYVDYIRAGEPYPEKKSYRKGDEMHTFNWHEHTEAQRQDPSAYAGGQEMYDEVAAIFDEDEA